jgi:hypothetical protein
LGDETGGAAAAARMAEAWATERPPPGEAVVRDWGCLRAMVRPSNSHNYDSDDSTPTLLNMIIIIIITIIIMIIIIIVIVNRGAHCLSSTGDRSA